MKIKDGKRKRNGVVFFKYLPLPKLRNIFLIKIIIVNFVYISSKANHRSPWLTWPLSSLSSEHGSWNMDSKIMYKNFIVIYELKSHYLEEARKKRNIYKSFPLIGFLLTSKLYIGGERKGSKGPNNFIAILVVESSTNSCVQP